MKKTFVFTLFTLVFLFSLLFTSKNVYAAGTFNCIWVNWPTWHGCAADGNSVCHYNQEQAYCNQWNNDQATCISKTGIACFSTTNSCGLGQRGCVGQSTGLGGCCALTDQCSSKSGLYADTPAPGDCAVASTVCCVTNQNIGNPGGPSEPGTVIIPQKVDIASLEQNYGKNIGFNFTGARVGTLLSGPKGIVAIIFVIAGLILLLQLIAGGFKFMTSQGDPSACDESPRRHETIPSEVAQ